MGYVFYHVFFVTGSGLMWKNVVGSICKSYNISDDTVNLLVITWSLASTLTRLFCGVASDATRFKVRRPLWLIFGATIMLTTHFIYIFAKDTVIWVVTVGTGMGYGALWATHPTLTSLLYGMDHLSLNLSLMGFAPAFSGLLYTALANPFSDDNYVPLFAFSCGGLVIAILLSAYIAYVYDPSISEAPSKQTDNQILA